MATSGKRGKPWGTPALRARMMKAIALNRRESGNANYDEVREQEEFAPWVGKEAGETGRQRFKRLVKKVREPLPKDRTRPYQSRDENSAQYGWAEQEAHRANAKSNLPIRLTPEQIMAGGGTVLVGFSVLQDLIAEVPLDLQRSRDALLIDDPNGIGGKRTIDPELMQKQVLITVQTAKGIADLLRDYSSVFPTMKFAEGAMKVALDLAGTDPDAQLRVIQKFAELIQQLNGLGPGSQPT